jgi:3-oxoacyl-[acyl-carrier protein] reductase
MSVENKYWRQQMSKTLEGKVAVVTGGSLGIGASIAEHLAGDGAAVVVNYRRSKDRAEALVKQIQEKGGRAIACQADVRVPAQAEALVQAAVSAYGKLDILVNNAGVYEFSPLEAVTEDFYDRQFDTNVKGLVFATQAAVKAMGDQGGSIINISSVVATMPPPNSSVYSATKGAVDTLTKALASELGPKRILVNAISPGATESEGFFAMEGHADAVKWFVSATPLGRMGKPEDIAKVVAFLASPDAAWITGQVIPVSGGIRV